jgi:FAD dependent oxidoreductase
MRMRRRVAVIGAGIFGSTAAFHAARQGHEVHLFEKKNQVLQAASRINQYRLHSGYHYPRSPETAESCRHAESSFRSEYGDAIIRHARHLYGIAKNRSKVSLVEFLSFCRAYGLPYDRVEVPRLINPDVADVVEVAEASFDFDVIFSLVNAKLRQSGVIVHLGARFNGDMAKNFDNIILASYSCNNELLAELGLGEEEYQYEVCEKPVVTLPRSFGDTDIVIIDGPFMSVGPMGRTGAYVLGHVEHAIHHSNIGPRPEIPASIRPYLNKGIVEHPPSTRVEDFIKSGSAFIPALRLAAHAGSMYTIRAVLPYRDATDERPTLVERVGTNIVKIFSGKISTCVEAAQTACELI